MRDVNNNQLNLELNNNLTGGVYIYSSMCGTCAVAKKMLSVVETVDNPNIIAINGNFCPQLLQNYHVMSIPALLLFKDGKLVKTVFAFHDVMYLRNLFKNL